MARTNPSTESGGFVVFFIVGFLAALLIGWLVYPKVIYSQKSQPIAFNHKVHIDEVGMACEDCHGYRDDGTFIGFPTTESCGDCHAEATGESEAIDILVTDYLEAGKEIQWYAYQYQPDNVFFSHVAHQGFECTSCHPDVGGTEVPPPYYENILTGYSSKTMKMWQCERCHAELGVSNGCYICHM